MNRSIGGYTFDEENNDQKINVIGEVILPEFPQDVCADAGIVLGATIITPFVIREAVTFLKNGQLDHLFLCGGVVINDQDETKLFAPLVKSAGLPLPEDGETEADYMVRYLTLQGISKTHYSVENASTNTGENLRNIMGLPAYKKAKSGRLIGLLPTRALMTLRREELKAGLSPIIATLTNVIPLPGVTKEKWPGIKAAAGFILAEFAKIDPTNSENYFNKGFCKDIDLKEEIRRANTLPHLPASPALQGPKSSPAP